jgi:hypothetical protein
VKSFLTWLETEESPGLSQPQHKKGEDDMALDDVVGKRILAMVKELKDEGKGTEEALVASLARYVKKMAPGDGGDQNQADGGQPPAQQQPQQNQQQPQAPQANPTAQGPGGL